MDFVIDKLDGQCPVQGTGEVRGKPFYFRARGDTWRISVGDADHPDWFHEEPYGDGIFAAGWMTHEEARSFIGTTLKRYLSEVA
ncbi:hypothetical protein [Phenylobacterium sp.]|uniref:hypothetical protein n=1 Tax=Phenylobacterium sp. TaxID=1871053 RepID=UPI0039837686